MPARRRPNAHVARWKPRVDWKTCRHPFPLLIITPAEARKPALIWRLKPVAVEFRFDLLRDLAEEKLRALVTECRRRRIAVLATARRRVDGGSWRKSAESARREELLKWAPLADAVDFEIDGHRDLATFLPRLRAAMRPGAALLLSHHNLKSFTPLARLTRWHREARQRGAARFKAAVLCRTGRDARRLTRWAIEANGLRPPVTVIGLGRAAAVTRLVIPCFVGGPAYAPARDAVAPGQMPYDVVQRCFAVTAAARRKMPGPKMLLRHFDELFVNGFTPACPEPPPSAPGRWCRTPRPR